MRMFRLNYNKNNQLLISLIILLISAIFVTLNSFSTSPLYPDYYGGDSSQFLTMGRGWASGKLPYRDMFDHKGPVIFLINMIGYIITGGNFGVFILQVFFLFFSCCFLYKMAMLVEDAKIYCMFCVILALFQFSKNYVDGDTVEEWCLPFIALSVYYIYKYLKFDIKNQPVHNPKFALLYGISFGVCFLSRATNAVLIGCGVLIITIYLIINRNWKNLFENAVMFILGFCLLCLPFSAYFAYHNCLGDFFYGTLGYNMEYSKNMPSWTSSITGDALLRFFSIYFVYITGFLTLLLCLSKKDYYLSAFIALALLLESQLFFSGALFSQYAAVILPQLVIAINEIYLLFKEKNGKSFVSIAIISFIMIYAYGIAIQRVKDYGNMKATYSVHKVREYESLFSYIPLNERSSFVTYGDNALKDAYLVGNLLPVYKYFAIQEWQGGFSQYVKNEIRKEFESKNAKWILTHGSITNIQDILENNYIIVAQNNDYYLYNLKN